MITGWNLSGIISIAISGNRIFVGTIGGGVFESSEDGGYWINTNEGLSNYFLRALAISEGSLFAGSGGGGVFINSSLLSSGTEDENQYTNSDLIIYPNPANNTINIEATGLGGAARIAIFNTAGQRIIDQQVTDVQTAIDIRHLSAGIYFLHYGNVHNSYGGRFVKE